MLSFINMYDQSKEMLFEKKLGYFINQQIAGVHWVAASSSFSWIFKKTDVFAALVYQQVSWEEHYFLIELYIMVKRILEKNQGCI